MAGSEITTLVGSRQFHVDIEDLSKKKWSFDITVDQETLEQLSQGEDKDKKFSIMNNEGVIELCELSPDQAELRVVQELARAALEECSQSVPGKNGKNQSFDVLVQKGIDATHVNVSVRNQEKGVESDKGFHEWEVHPENAPTSPIRVVDTTNHKTMLEQFCAKPKFTGTFGPLKKALHPLMSRLSAKFDSIKRWWDSMIGMEMPWNLQALAAICNVNENGDVPIQSAVRYMARLTATSNPKLSAELEKGASRHKEFEALGRKVGGKTDEKSKSKIRKCAEKTVKGLNISTTSDEAFIPVTYEGGEVLLGVKMTAAGNYQLLLHGAPDGLAAEMNLIENMSEGELITTMKGVITCMVDKKGSADLVRVLSSTGTPLKVTDLAKYEGSSPIHSVRAAAATKFQSGKGEEAEKLTEYADLALQMRTFVDACHASDNWLADPDYHSAVIKQCSVIMAQGEALLSQKSITDSHMQHEFSSLLNHVGEILTKAENNLPKAKVVTETTLDVLGGDVEFPAYAALPGKIGEVTSKPLTPDLVLQTDLEAQGATAAQLVRLRRNAIAPTDSSWINGSLLYEMRTREMKYFGNRHADETIWDCLTVKQDNRYKKFPTLESLGLTNEEELALIWTLHSQNNQQKLGNGVEGGNLEEAGKLGRAMYTLQVLLIVLTMESPNKSKFFLIC